MTIHVYISKLFSIQRFCDRGILHAKRLANHNRRHLHTEMWIQHIAGPHQHSDSTSVSFTGKFYITSFTFI